MAVLAFSAIFLTTSNVMAQRGGFRQADPEQIMSVLKNRLGLTPEQETQVGPIITDQIEKRRAVFEKYKEQGRGNKREMRSEMRAIRKDVESRLGTILTPEQMETFRKFQDEKRKEQRGKMRKRKG